MGKGRLEAFSDGVMAILITIMVLELKTPHGHELSALKPLFPVFLSYLLSFIYLGIYWNNHHHMLHAVHRVTGGILWSNLHLLFWLSLVPFATAWMGEHPFASAPTVLYGVMLLMAAISYTFLQSVIVRVQGPDSVLKSAVGNDVKGKASVACYTLGIVAGFFVPAVSYALYTLVAFVWLIPDRRIERTLAQRETPAP